MHFIYFHPTSAMFNQQLDFTMCDDAGEIRGSAFNKHMFYSCSIDLYVLLFKSHLKTHFK